MVNRSRQFSPQVYARVGGVLNLIIIAAGMVGELFVRGASVISGDPAATARNIMGVRRERTRLRLGSGLIFFGAACSVVGCLIVHSVYLPGTLGVLMAIAGVCYLTNNFALILSPALSSRLFPAVLLPPFVAELSMAQWLLVKGVNMSKWAEVGT